MHIHLPHLYQPQVFGIQTHMHTVTRAGRSLVQTNFNLKTLTITIHSPDFSAICDSQDLDWLELV